MQPAACGWQPVPQAAGHLAGRHVGHVTHAACVVTKATLAMGSPHSVCVGLPAPCATKAYRCAIVCPLMCVLALRGRVSHRPTALPSPSWASGPACYLSLQGPVHRPMHGFMGPLQPGGYTVGPLPMGVHGYFALALLAAHLAAMPLQTLHVTLASTRVPRTVGPSSLPHGVVVPMPRCTLLGLPVTVAIVCPPYVCVAAGPPA